MENKSENLIWLLLGSVFVAVAVVIVISVLLGGRYNYGYGYGGSFGMMGGYGNYGTRIFMMVAAVISVILVVIILYFLLAASFSSRPHDDIVYMGHAEKTAKERYARGEITEDEYHKIMDTIRR